MKNKWKMIAIIFIIATVYCFVIGPGYLILTGTVSAKQYYDLVDDWNVIVNKYDACVKEYDKCVEFYEECTDLTRKCLEQNCSSLYEEFIKIYDECVNANYEWQELYNLQSIMYDECLKDLKE